MTRNSKVCSISSPPILNFKDNAFNFTYQEFDRIEYQQNQFTTNLTAMLAYYCYLIIGHDMDSYQRLGGTPFFQQCEEIVNACQSASMDNSEQKGWLAFDSNRNRYALVNNLLDEAFKKYRNFYYEYHRLGLDEMSGNVTNGRARIAEGLPVLHVCHQYFFGCQSGRTGGYLQQRNRQREKRCI